MTDSKLWTRREAIQLTAAAAAAGWASSRAVAAPAPRQPFLLSLQGSGRATAYVEANRIITRGDRTHVTWLDSTADGFRVRIRTLDRARNQWSPVYAVGPAFDNHGGPALTIDKDGFLHTVYYPHHHAFRYRRSKRPNDASEWERETQFGEKLTYPTLVCAPDNTLHVTARRSDSQRPWGVEHWIKPPAEKWRKQSEVIRSGTGGYSHFQEALAWSPDNRTLHLSCRIYQNGGMRETIGYMRTDDFGATWRRHDGTVIKLPATTETMDVLADGGRVDGQRSHKCGSMAVDPDGLPYVMYSSADSSSAEMIVATPPTRRGGEWKQTPIARHIDRRFSEWRIGPPAGMTFDREGTMFIAAAISRGDKRELIQLTSRDRGVTFAFEHITGDLDHERKMMPSLERPTGHNPVGSRPGLIFTGGTRGESTDDVLSNKVYWLG
ncbi:MAG: BNR-4 repeat-containing protein [Pirellulaceae bacterium]|jgi:hypothetical protein|nr:BNR-4 repeat-containing protein [Pirellulaceae bacterium]MDP7014331.1 BNR-4 repeat-containing protein [Pirellulaceae bacterium]